MKPALLVLLGAAAQPEAQPEAQADNGTLPTEALAQVTLISRRGPPTASAWACGAQYAETSDQTGGPPSTLVVMCFLQASKQHMTSCLMVALQGGM